MSFPSVSQEFPLAFRGLFLPCARACLVASVASACFHSLEIWLEFLPFIGKNCRFLSRVRMGPPAPRKERGVPLRTGEARLTCYPHHNLTFSWSCA